MSAYGNAREPGKLINDGMNDGDTPPANATVYSAEDLPQTMVTIIDISRACDWQAKMDQEILRSGRSFCNVAEEGHERKTHWMKISTCLSTKK